MLGFFNRVFGSDDAAKRDARRVYDTLMTQSRDRGFYGEGRIPDTQAGRIEALILHIAPVVGALSQLGDQGRLLSQAVFDTMKDDFDVALREDGYSDSGVKRRIKPMIQRFYAGLDAYTKALDSGDVPALEQAIAVDVEDAEPSFIAELARYMESFRSSLGTKSLGEIASAQFGFPALAP